MKLSGPQQRNVVSEGFALGLLMNGTDQLPKDTIKVGFAFAGAWREWRHSSALSQVTTDLRSGLNEYIAITRADERKQTFALYWVRYENTWTVFSRSDDFDAGNPSDLEFAARTINGDLPATAWAELARTFLERLA
ncbi:hypothetical protein [Brevibacterium aurantiacum]|uniref:hypothetical protein n=1 Tax=Brevibacterium aurantiacum TaxID=273384 RepID=UPI000FCA7588|nr:hypothetical protein [Brevibacterium aurantiacum]